MFLRILKQSFNRNRGRKSLAALAVLAGMTVATAMLTVRVNIGDDLQHELRSYGANIEVTPAADTLPVSINGVDLRPARSGAYLNEKDLPRIKTIFWTNNIVAFAPLLFEPVHVNGRSLQMEGTWFNHELTIPGSTRVIHTGMLRLSPTWEVQGQWPKDDSHTVLAGRRLAAELHLQPGSTLTVAGTQGSQPLTVAGILSTGGPEEEELVAPLAIAQQVGGVPGKLREILVSAVTKPEDSFARRDPRRLTPAEAERWMCSPYALTIAHQIADAIPGASARPIRPVAQSEGVILSKLDLLILLITLAALAASALAISSVMTASVLERRYEIALMKAVGAQDSTIGSLFLTEAALLGVGGGVAGFILGEMLAALISRHVLGYAAAWKPALAPLILLLAAAVVILGSLGALRRAMRLDPAVILRGGA